jgi:hypothetical protein
VQSRGAEAVNFLQELFSSDGFLPHGHCYLWDPFSVLLRCLHLDSDAVERLS